MPKKYVSPQRAFTQKANKLCPAYKAAKGLNAKLSACTECRFTHKGQPCVVEEGNQ